MGLLGENALKCIGGKCIKFRLQGSSGTQIQAGDFLGDTLILTVQERLLVSDPRGRSWTQAMGPSWRGQCPQLIIASCGVHQTHSHCKPWILQADSKSMWLPSATKTHSYRTFRRARTQTAVNTRSWSWPPHSYTHIHARVRTHTHTHTHTHFSAPSPGSVTFSWPLNAGLHRAYSSDLSSCLHCLSRWSHLV